MSLETDSLNAIEWPNLLKQYSDVCLSTPAKQKARTLLPETDRKKAETLIWQTREAYRLLKRVPVSFLGQIPIIDETLERLRVASTLSGLEFRKISELLDICLKTTQYYRAQEKIIETKRFFESIKRLDQIHKNIDNAISEEGFVNDHASAELKSLTREKKNLETKINNKLQNIIQSAAKSGALQDNFIDLRDGRYVIPIIKDLKHKIDGIVYESSSTEATLLVEPAAIRPLNDELKSVSANILTEQERILRELTHQLQPHQTTLQQNHYNLVAIDLIFARARFAIKYAEFGSVSEPIFANYFSLQNFYHPLLIFLLSKDEIVKTDLSLEREQKTLVISGPNTGGKTVLLKAVGLLNAMARSGFYIPADSGATLPWHNAILAHIGDEQSIEKSLSSFSASIIAMKEIVDQATENSLVLSDEIFSSTDPDEATALATSLLEFLHSKSAMTIVTTHLTGLKAVSAEKNTFVNACVEFNNETMLPTFRLRIGIPGRSRAIETAERFGLKKQIINEAKKLIGPEMLKLEALLARVEDKEREINDYESTLNKLQTEILQEKQKLSADNARLVEEKNHYRENIQIEMKAVEAKALKELEETILEYREKLKKIRFQPDEFAKTKRILQKTKQPSQPKLQKPTPTLSAEVIAANREELRKNGSVRLLHLDKTGVLLTDPIEQSDQAEVQVGILKIKVPWSQLASSAEKNNTKSYNPIVSSGKRENFSDDHCEPELILLGARTDEVYEKLTQFLDRALRSGRPNVRIIHGLGSGKVKKAVHEILKKGPYKLAYRAAEKGEGGDGCTVVLLDES